MEVVWTHLNNARRASVLRTVVAIWALISCLSHGALGLSHLSRAEMQAVLNLAKSISHLQPKLSESKSVEYALGIYQAARKYSLEPGLLVAITHQETSFREDLPEGAAGEIGICQIRKAWVENKKFRDEFPTASVRDLGNPAKSFQFAAWILADLKESTRKGDPAPWWTYYNARKLRNRFKYYALVDKKLHRIKKLGPFMPAERALATAAAERPAEKPMLAAAALPAELLGPRIEIRKEEPKKVEKAEPVTTKPQAQKLPASDGTKTESARSEVSMTHESVGSVPPSGAPAIAMAEREPAVIEESSEGAQLEGSWIFQAVKALKVKNAKKWKTLSPQAPVERIGEQEKAAPSRVHSPSLLRAAVELGVRVQ